VHEHKANRNASKLHFRQAPQTQRKIQSNVTAENVKYTVTETHSEIYMCVCGRLYVRYTNLNTRKKTTELKYYN
jgi:hypothetical protein